MTRKAAFFNILITLLFVSCHKGDEPVTCSVANAPYVYNQGGARLALPTAFTPNGDGRNDYFKAIGAANLQTFGLAVFDASGNILFQTTNAYTGWNGTYSGGGYVPAGNYVVQVQFTTLNGDAVDKHLCMAVLGTNGGNCFITNGNSYYFEDQFDPATGNVLFSTGENLCPY